MNSNAPAVRALVAILSTLAFVVLSLTAVVPHAGAQDVDLIAGALESDGYFLESGAFGDAADFESLVRDARSSDEPWYFVSMAGSVGPDFADELRDLVRPTGNVLLYFVDNDGFEVVQLASSASESVENAALVAFDSDGWTDPEDFMDDVVRDFDRLNGSAPSGGSSSGSSTGSGATPSTDSGGGSIWPWLAIPAVLIGGGMWFSGRRRRKKSAETDLETAQKIRTELQSELDELANDVIVLSSPVDLSENQEAIDHYRQATATYTAISDEIPDSETLETLEKADLAQLSALGARVAHARWQMDAAEAIVAGEPIPEKPQIAPPPVETPAKESPTPRQRPRNLERRQPRPRVPYSRSRRRSGGGLLDILIAGSGMLGGGRSRSRSRRSSGGLGDIFGGGSRQRRQAPRSRTSRGRSSRRPGGGGVFGGGSSSRRSSRRSTTRRKSRSSSSRTRSRSSSSRRSTSRRRRR